MISVLYYTFHSHGAGPTGWGRGIYERPAAAHWCNLCVNRRSAQATETHVYPRRAFESICPFRHRDELFSPLSHIALERGYGVLFRFCGVLVGG